MRIQCQLWFRGLLLSCALSVLAACGSGDDGNVTVGAFTVGGQVSGLSSGKSVVLQNNGGDDLTVATNGSFTFATLLDPHIAYTVTIRTQPTGQICTLRNASGTATANVSNIALTCQDVAAGLVKPVYVASTYYADRASLLAQANEQGARGYAYVTGLVISYTPSEYINLYVKDAATTYVWEALDMPANATDLQEQLNTQGSRGFALSTFLTDGVVSSVYYVKDVHGLAPYSYELLPRQTTSSAFLSQANAQGVRGYVWLDNFVIGGTTVSMYGKDGSNARYTYAVQSPPSADTLEAFVSQANQQGQQGYRFRGAYEFTGNPSAEAYKYLYVKDAAQAATFDYKVVTTSSGGDALVNQANAEGQAGYFYVFSSLFGNSRPGVTRYVYGKPINCNGVVMCRGSSPL